MNYMYILHPLCKGYVIEKWEIIYKYYENNQMKYYIKRPEKSLLAERYDMLIIDEKHMAHNESIIAAFSPKCALLKHIMFLNNNIIELGEKLGNKYVEAIYKDIHKVKEELEKYL